MEFAWLIGFVVLLMCGIGAALLHAYQMGGREKYSQGYDACELKYLKRDHAYRKQLESGRAFRGSLE